MRRSRLGQNKGLANKAVFVLIAVALVGSGYLIGRYILSSLFDKPAGGAPVTGEPSLPTGTPTATVQVKTKPQTLYKVQIGAFSTLENAEKAADAAIGKGVGAAAQTTPDPLYKVYCGVAGSKSAAEKLAKTAQPKLAGSVIGTSDNLYVATVEVSSRSFTLTGPEDQTKVLEDAFAKADAAVESLLAYWDSQYLGKENPVSLQTMESELSTLSSDLGAMTPATTLDAAAKAAKNVLSNMVLATRGARDAAGGDSTKAAEGATAFMKALDMYTKELKTLSP